MNYHGFKRKWKYFVLEAVGLSILCKVGALHGKFYFSATPYNSELNESKHIR